MMDAQTQAIESALIAGIFREPEAKSMRILLRVVREQDELLASHAPHGHNYTNEQYVNLLSEIERNKTRLESCSQIVKMLEQFRNDADKADGSVASYWVVDMCNDILDKLEESK